MKKEVKKAAKLNVFDRQVLMAYSGVSLETGTRIAAQATDIKALHKNLSIKV